MVGMNDAAGFGATVLGRHVERIHDEVGVLNGVNGPTDDPATE